MTSNTPIDLFSRINMDDAKSVAESIKQFCFDDLDQQSSYLNALKDDLGLSITALAKILAIPKPTMERFIFAKTAMKPVHVRALALFLYIRSTDHRLFNQLTTID